MRLHRRTNERGTTLAPMLVVVLVSGALSAALIMVNLASQREANTMLARERAFQLAEAGVDWVLSDIRINNGSLPDEATQTLTPGNTGDFTISVFSGDDNGFDDDGDGQIDNSEENSFKTIFSTGVSGGVRRTLQVALRETIEVPVFEGALQFNVDFPIIDLNGSAFIVDGRDHDLNGNLDVTSGLGQPGMASPADVDFIVDQVRERFWDQIVGADGNTPSVATIDPVELDRMVEQAAGIADQTLGEGTHSHPVLGSPTLDGIQVTYAEGDVHLTGNGTGAGLLAIDGDLIITGEFTFTGIVLVRGRIRLSGGGSTKQVIGALVAGEEVTASVSETEVTVSGNVDINYSSDAIALATRRLAIMSVVSVTEVGNPPLP